MLGTLLHFTYDLSGGNKIVGAFSAMNESIWEHLKLIFFPMILFSIFEYFFAKDKGNCFISSKLLGTIAGMMLIVVLFYTLSGITGAELGFINIIIFISGVVFANFISYTIQTSCIYTNSKSEVASAILVIILIIAFVCFTFSPPNIGIFWDPQSVQTLDLNSQDFLQLPRFCFCHINFSNNIS